MVRKAYPEAADGLQDSLAKDQFIDELEDQEMWVEASGIWTKDARWSSHSCFANQGDVRGRVTT